MSKLHHKLIWKGTLTVVTGLHIGQGREGLEIGGIDLQIVRNKQNYQPYIPGSSLKGKLRCLLEQAMGVNGDSKSHFKDSYKGLDDSIKTSFLGLFGAGGGSNDGHPSRLLVRDAYLTEESAKALKENPFTDVPYAEVKFENTINRIQGTATNPRQAERVPPGAVFDVEFVINVWGEDDNKAKQNEEAWMQWLKTAIDLLHDDSLGKSGSRGYGQVKLEMKDPIKRSVGVDYKLPTAP